MKATTTSEFIEKAIIRHGNLYDYSHCEYANNHTKIKISCHEHGIFEQRPDAHIKGQGCPLCGNKKMIQSKTKTTHYFIEKAQVIHGDKYNYDSTNYQKRQLKVKIICPSHGEFLQKAGNHLNGRGCPLCMKEKFTKTIERFIIEAKQIHGDKYNYHLVEYKNTNKKVKITCPIHGLFLQSPTHHLRQQGCPKCQSTFKLTNEEFINRANQKHKNVYTYDLVSYINVATKVIINCKLHGQFAQTPNRHLKGEGCPKCNMSKGELRIRNWLTINNFCFDQQVKFSSCKNKRSLPFDFSIKIKNNLSLIEYHGEQHYKQVNFTKNKSRAEFKYNQTINNDQIKKEWCLKHNINLFVIPYWDYENIETILEDFIFINL